MDFLAALAVGIIAGTHTATWGMYKDAPHEGFRHYSRSIFTAAVLAPLIYWGFSYVPLLAFDPMTARGIVLLFGLTYCAERGATEFYKTFVRFEDQSKYTIPMQFHVFGNVIPAGAKRWGIAIGHVIVVLLSVFLIHLHNTPDEPISIVKFLLLGSVGGWLSAFGGAFKDAPIEGFHTFKFFRSPALAAFYSWLLSFLTDSYMIGAVGGLGYTVATIETYKTFFFPNVPRGKFAGKPVLFPEHLETRKKFVPVYFGIWLFVIISIAQAIRVQYFQ